LQKSHKGTLKQERSILWDSIINISQDLRIYDSHIIKDIEGDLP